MAKEDKEKKWKPGMECVPGSVKLEDGKEYLCNKKGKWKLTPKDKDIQSGINRVFPSDKSKKQTLWDKIK